VSTPRHKTWEHAIETVLCLGTVTLAVAALLPYTHVPGWLPPLIEGLAGMVIALSVWAATGRGPLSAFCAAFGVFLAGWTIWAEIARVWDYAVLAAWIIAMLISCPVAGHALMAPQPAGPPMLPGQQPGAITEASPEEDLREEMAKFEHMFSKIGCDKVQVLELARERAGRVLRLQLPRSGQVTIQSLEAVSSKVEVILRLRPGAVEFETGENSSDVVMRLRENDVFAEVARLRPEVRATTINEPFAIGVQEDGSILKIMLRELHLFIGGTTGAGKSNLINVLLAQLSYMADTVIWVIDMKGGRTARPWLQAWIEGKADAPAIDWVATTRDEASLMMKAFNDAIEARSTSGIGGSKITPSPGLPQVILICDEMAALFGTGRGGRAEVGEGAVTNTKFIALAEAGVQMARSEAVTSIWATQRGTVDMAGSGTLKSLCLARIALGMSTENELGRVIPDARVAVKSLAKMALTAGLGIFAVGRNASMLTRFFHHDHIDGACSDNGNDGCVASCPVYMTTIDVGGIRPRLDRLTAEALGTAYANRWQRAEHLLRRPAPAGGSMEPLDTTGFEGIMAGMEDPEKKIHPVRKRARELLAARGVRGATPKWLRDKMAEEGIIEDKDYARETLQRWLREDSETGMVHSGEFGLWIIGPGS
jgi:Helicase HerA, central domain